MIDTDFYRNNMILKIDSQPKFGFKVHNEIRDS